MQQPPNSVLAVGGCQINGYPYDTAASFVSLALGDAGQGAITRVAPVAIHRAHTLFDQHAALVPGATVILQFGNLESIKGAAALRDYADNTPGATAPTHRLHWGHSLRRSPLREVAKYALLLGRLALGRAPYDAPAFRADFTRFCQTLVAHGPGRVVVMGAFRAYSPAVNRMRRRLNRDMAQIAADFGFAFVDSYGALTVAQGAKGQGRLYADPIHLDRRGQQVLADALAKVLA